MVGWCHRRDQFSVSLAVAHSKREEARAFFGIRRQNKQTSSSSSSSRTEKKGKQANDRPATHAGQCGATPGSALPCETGIATVKVSHPLPYVLQEVASARWSQSYIKIEGGENLPEKNYEPLGVKKLAPPPQSNSRPPPETRPILMYGRIPCLVALEK